MTGLSTRVTERDLEDHFSREGKVGISHLDMNVKSVCFLLEISCSLSHCFLSRLATSSH